MKIRTQFILNMTLFSVALLVIAVSLAITDRQVNTLQIQEGAVVNIERAISELGYLSNDYLLFQEDQQYARWDAKWSAASREMEKLEPRSPKQKTLVDNMKDHHRSMRMVFGEVNAAFLDETQTPGIKPSQALIQRSGSRLAVQSQELAFDASQLSRSIHLETEQLKQANEILILGLLGLFGIYFIANYLIVQGRLLKSIAALHSGTKVVGQGNLDFMLEVKRDDEVGELSHAFNKMTGDLKGVMASKAELEKEIVEREAAERALHEERERLSVTLGSIGDGVVATNVEAKIVLLNGVAQELTGWTQEEAKGKPLLEVFNIVNEITGEPAEDPVDKVLKTGVIVGLANHTALIAKDGVKRSIADSCAPIRSRGGSIIGSVLVFRDVSEEYKAGRLRDALNEINSAINSTLDFDEIMQRVVVKAAEATGCDVTSIETRKDGYWEARYLYGLPDEMLGMRLAFEEAKGLEKAVMTKEPFIVGGGDVGRLLSPRVIETFDIHSMMLMPIMIKGEVVSALRFVDQSDSIIFTEVQVDFARKLAASISLALENARLFAVEIEARSQAKDELEHSNLLLRAADALAETIDLDRMLESLADIVLEVTGRRRAGIYLLDKKTHDLESKASRGEFTVPVGSRFNLNQLAPQFQSVVYEKESRIIDYESLDVPEENRHRAQAMDIKMALTVPLIFKGEVLGILTIDNPGEAQNVTDREIELVEGIAAQAAVAIENARLYEGERRIADTLQEALLVVPEGIEGIDYGHIYRSATEGARVGGDLYDLFEIESGRIGITLGDVSGKGLNAATLTSVVRNSIRAYALEGYGPSGIMAKTNDAVRMTTGQSSFVTVFFAILDVSAGTLRYCSAGHPPAILYRASDIEWLRQHSPIIGAFEDMIYTEEEIDIRRGDRLITYTDGITEARCDGGFYGEDRLVAALTKSKEITINRIPHKILEDVVEYSGGKLLDDVAVLALSLSE